MRRHFKASSPALNANRLQEPYATDTLFASEKALYGYTCAQIYVGRKSYFTVLYPLRTESEMSQTLYDLAREVGVPTGLISDGAKTQNSAEVKKFLRTYHIWDWQSEPHQQNQNFAERRIQEVKGTANLIMDRTKTPGDLWFQCMKYVVYVLNRLSHRILKNKTPMEVGHGIKPDISDLLQFQWYEKVYYLDPDAKFPDSKELSGRFVGIAEHCGAALTYEILTDDTYEIIKRSAVRSAKDPQHANYRAGPDDGKDGEEKGTSDFELIDSHADFDFELIDPSDTEESHETSTAPLTTTPSPSPLNCFIENITDHDRDTEPDDIRFPTVDPSTIFGKIVTVDHQGSPYRAVVTGTNVDGKYVLKIDEGNREELRTYSEICDLIANQTAPDDDPDRIWTFTDIMAHRRNKKNRLLEVHVLWDNGEKTWEPLLTIAKDDPITCAHYASEHGLLDRPGWKRLKKYRQLNKRYVRAFRSAQVHAASRGDTRFKFGVQVPMTVQQAYDLDKENGNTLWNDAIEKEMIKIFEHDTFKDLGTDPKSIPHGYKRLHCHLVFDVKSDLRRKARFVAGGHRTEDPKDGIFAGIANIRAVRMAIQLAEINGLETWALDIGNANLHAKTKEKLYVVAGPEYGDLQGHYLLVEQSLYGLHSSGFRFAELLADILREMGFFPSKADPAIWMKDYGEYYGFVVTWVDDLLIMSRKNQEIIDGLGRYFKKLQDVGPPKHYLGAGFQRMDKPEKVLVMTSAGYVERAMSHYERTFGSLPKKSKNPLEPKDHPEMDDSALCESKDIHTYQSLIGMLQWLVTLGRWDIQCAVQCLSSYRTMPRIGHLERAKKIFGYLRSYPNASIKFRTDIPVHENAKILGDPQDWAVLYGHPTEEIPKDCPTPKGNPVRTTTYVDANLLFCMMTGRSCTGILHFLNGCPIDSYSKKQRTVETATYGSELVAAKTAIEQIIDLRYMLRHLGAPLDGPAWLFGDNMSAIMSTTIPASTLKKPHNALALHRIREAVATGIVNFCHIDGTKNKADVLTKFLSNSAAYPLLHDLFHWRLPTDGAGADSRGVSATHIDRVVLSVDSKDSTKIILRLVPTPASEDYDHDHDSS